MLYFVSEKQERLVDEEKKVSKMSEEYKKSFRVVKINKKKCSKFCHNCRVSPSPQSISFAIKLNVKCKNDRNGTSKEKKTFFNQRFPFLKSTLLSAH